MKTEWRVTVTADDLRFLREAEAHYKLFAETSKMQGEEKSAGILEAQRFRAENFMYGVEAVKTLESREVGDHE